MTWSMLSRHCAAPSATRHIACKTIIPLQTIYQTHADRVEVSSIKLVWDRKLSKSYISSCLCPGYENKFFFVSFVPHCSFEGTCCESLWYEKVFDYIYRWRFKLILKYFALGSAGK